MRMTVVLRFLAYRHKLKPHSIYKKKILPAQVSRCCSARISNWWQTRSTPCGRISPEQTHVCVPHLLTHSQLSCLWLHKGEACRVPHWPRSHPKCHRISQVPLLDAHVKETATKCPIYRDNKSLLVHDHNFTPQRQMKRIEPSEMGLRSLEGTLKGAMMAHI